MQLRLNKHFAYTRVIRPIARVLVWLPIFGAVTLCGGPLALAFMPLLTLGLIIGIALSFRKSRSDSMRLSTLLSRHSHRDKHSMAARWARARFDL
jgi:hypothetical protein